MTILATDIVFLQSERLTDASNGGGLMTGNVVQSGQENNLFNDISDLSRTYGEVAFRKLFAALQNDSADVFLGGHVIIAAPPTDSNVDVTIFTTKSWTDERDAARNYVENYSIAGPESRWMIFGDQITGQRVLLLYSVTTNNSPIIFTNDPLPEAGSVMMLSVEKTGYERIYQAVRVEKILNREIQQFNDGANIFYKDILMLQITSPLRYTFVGSTPTRALLSRSNPDASPTLFRKTTTADAAYYYGVKPLIVDAAINDLTIKVPSIYAKLVPSAEAETPILDQAAGMAAVNYVPSSANQITFSVSLTGDSANSYTATVYLMRGITPGTLALAIDGVMYKDDSNGNIVLSNNALGTYTGTVNYATGAVTLTRTSGWSAAIIATALPCVAIVDNTVSGSIAVKANNRFYVYVFMCKPVPSPGALVVDFRAAGKWYRLTDNSNGRLEADAQGIGSGTVNYATGSVSITLENLPDIGSNIVFTWANQNRYQIQTNVIAQPRIPAMRHTLAHAPIDASTLIITWGSKTTSIGDGSALINDATGFVNTATGEIVLIPTELPPSGTDFNISYSSLAKIEAQFTVTADESGRFTITLPETPVKPKSFQISFSVFSPRDDLYAGNALVMEQTPTLTPVFTIDNGEGGLVIGTINYSTGVVVVDAVEMVTVQKVLGTESTPGSPGFPPHYTMYIETTTEIQRFPANSTVSVIYSLASATAVTHTETVTLATIDIDLNTQNNRAFVANSLSFDVAGAMYFDRDGVLYTDFNPLNNSGLQAGSINYETGIATLTLWDGGIVNSLSLHSAVVSLANSYIAGISGRTPGSPLATGQFQVFSVASDGDNVIGSADFNGKIDTEWMQGQVDWEMGTYEIRFGKYLLDSTLSADVKANSGWYNADNIRPDGTIFAPRYIKPESVTFNTVLVSYIPLDADIVGLDNVRLPLDGRVPIFKPGSVIVVHHTERTALANPALAGAVYDIGRVRLAYARLYDADDTLIPTSLYATDLDAGTVTLANPLDLTSYAQPLVCEHRILDRSLATDVQVTGDITLQRRLSHTYPADETFVSSALVMGNLQARVTLLFDQLTWTNVWSDNVIGSMATSTYNDVVYPIVLTNQSAIQERFAVVFTSATIFNCYGEYSGLIGTGSVNATFEPLNPNTNTPYFSINPLGWGGGWSAGNVLRFNTSGANYPLWCARTIGQGADSVATDSFKLEILGNTN